MNKELVLSKLKEFGFILEEAGEYGHVLYKKLDRK